MVSVSMIKAYGGVTVRCYRLRPDGLGGIAKAERIMPNMPSSASAVPRDRFTFTLPDGYYLLTGRKDAPVSDVLRVVDGRTRWSTLHLATMHLLQERPSA